MARAKHPCAEPQCPVPVDAGTPRCPTHTRERDKARGTRQARGYDRTHDRERSRWQRLINSGAPIDCARCGTRILPGTGWHLDHTEDRTGYLGPSCIHCNLSAAGKASHR